MRTGAPAQTGAGRLAARAALHIGAGAVTLTAPKAAHAEIAAHETAIMLTHTDAKNLPTTTKSRNIRAIIAGPANGINAATREWVLAALTTPAALMLDADALTSFAETEHQKTLFAAIQTRENAATILTPHSGEFARLFPSLAKIAEKTGRLKAAQEAAKTAGAVLVLKGADTIIADPLGNALINANAPPDLATAGSGDVLAGAIGGLLAGGMPGFHAAAAGVWLHAEAARACGTGFTAEDLPPRLTPMTAWQTHNADVVER